MSAVLSSARSTNSNPLWAHRKRWARTSTARTTHRLNQQKANQRESVENSNYTNMKIATSSEYINEKLNIQPIPKERLKESLLMPIREEFGWKKRLKTGDVLVIQRSNITIYQYYISNNDFDIYANDPMFDGAITNDWKSKDGILLISHCTPTILSTPAFRVVGSLSNYKDDKMVEKENGNGTMYKIIAIYRMAKMQRPPKPSFFKYKPNLEENGWKQIYKRDDSELNEKLNIQPVSKERLNSRILETDGWKSKLKTGDFITITTKTKDTIGNILKKANSYIFVSLNDYQDYYEGDILDIGESAEKECGGGILVTSDRFDNLIYIPLARFEDDRMYLISIPHNIGKERMITRILRIPNLKQPLGRNFFINKTVDVSKCVQIYNRT